jgi:cytochrome c biogenesis protein ResB
MDAPAQGPTKSVSRLQRLVASAWHTLGSPKTTGILIVFLIVVVVLGKIFPQQAVTASPETGQATWISSLPPLVQLWGDLLYLLGFARIFRSLWFWLPLALLFLNSLIALAHYGPGSYRRLLRETPPIEWQHPLAGRAEYPARLPESPDTFLATLKTTLTARGWYIYKPSEAEERVVGAGRHRWSWGSVMAVYTALALAVVGASITYHFSQQDSFTLAPFEASRSRLFTGRFELLEFDRQQGMGWVTYTTPQAESPARSKQHWRLFRPFLFNRTLIMPFATESILTIEVRDSNSNLLKLIPVQENLPPTERLNLYMSDASRAAYFTIPAVGMSVQVLSGLDSPGTTFDVRVRHKSDSTSSESMRVEAGEALRVDDLSITITPTYDLKVMAYRDPALLLYLLSAILAAGGAAALLFVPPEQLWLIPEVKGRGGQLYGVVEKFGSIKDIPQFVEGLLEDEAKEETSADSAPARLEESDRAQKLGVN